MLLPRDDRGVGDESGRQTTVTSRAGEHRIRCVRKNLCSDAEFFILHMTRTKCLVYLLITAVVATIGIALAFRPIPSLITTNIATTTEPSAAAERAIAVSLSVGDKHYTASVPEDSTVIELMRSIASTAEFTFDGRDYPALGFFVESIAGKKNVDGYYWFLYVNGKPSETGASQTTLKDGDAVEWRYKKSH